jgi:glucose-1-phosphate adenylyltransferase
MTLTGNMLTLILATGADPRLRPLSTDRAKAAIPFGGNYRVIDFTLTNCLHSGLRRILVLTQYHSHSLLKHLRDGWSIFNPELGEFITPVAPQMRDQQYGYASAADAIRQNLYLLERSAAEHICIVSGDHVYRMDYSALLDVHVASGADATLACLDSADLPNAATQSYVAVDAQEQVLAVARGDAPLGLDDKTVRLARSMEVYAFRKQALRDLISKTDAPFNANHDLGIELVPRLLASGGKVRAYAFGGKSGRVTCDRYWRSIDTLDDYYAANMDLLKAEPQIDLYQQDWPIRTYQSQHPPARTVPGRSSNEGIFVNSMVASGAVIAGGGVNHSLLFPSVRVEDAATVEDCILLTGVVVGENARLYNCIVDKNVRIPPGTSIGYDPETDARRYAVTDRGIVVVAKTASFKDP